jgi:hypothetical protein
MQITDRFKKQAQSQPSGLEGLGGLLGRLGGGGLPRRRACATADEREPRQRGARPNLRLQGRQSQVAQNASTNTGLSPELLKKMLSMVAMLVAGYMAKQKNAGAADTAADAQSRPTGGLGGLRGGRAAGAQRTGAAGGIASMLDMDGDGNPLDDLMRMAGRVVR